MFSRVWRMKFSDEIDHYFCKKYCWTFTIITMPKNLIFNIKQSHKARVTLTDVKRVAEIIEKFSYSSRKILEHKQSFFIQNLCRERILFSTIKCICAFGEKHKMCVKGDFWVVIHSLHLLLFLTLKISYKFEKSFVWNLNNEKSRKERELRQFLTIENGVAYLVCFAKHWNRLIFRYLLKKKDWNFTKWQNSEHFKRAKRNKNCHNFIIIHWNDEFA